MKGEIDTGPFYRISIAGRPMPGTCKVAGRTRLDAKRDDITVTLTLTGLQLAELEELKPLLQPRGPGGELQPVDVENAALNIAGRLFVVEQIEPPKPAALAGAVEVVLRLRRALVEERQ